jgi:Leucine-rich repeat (LRR) protein
MFRLWQLKNLKHLYVMHTNVNNEGLQYISQLPSLRTLDIYNCLDISIEGLAHLKHLKNLNYLIFDDYANNIDDSMPFIAEITSLIHLKLCNVTTLTDIGLKYLTKLTCLKELDLS